MDIGSGKYLSFIPEGSKKPQKMKISREKERRDGFILCAMTFATNEAMLHYKVNHCANSGNRSKAYDMWAGAWMTEY